MKNIIEITIILFRDFPAMGILQDKNLGYWVTQKEFCKLIEAYGLKTHLSPTEVENIYYYLMNLIKDMDRMKKRGKEKMEGRGLNVFDPLFYIVDQLLLMQNGEALCHYESLLDWRSLTMKLDEDTLVTAFYAEHDLIDGYNRKSFEWNIVTKHNNIRINKLVAQGISENHFHLWGSTPFFQLSWIQLMNEITDAGFVNVLRELDHRRLRVSMHYDLDYQEIPFEIQHMQAVLIRLYLIHWMENEKLELEEYTVKPEEFFEKIPLDIMTLMDQIVVGEIKESSADKRRLALLKSIKEGDVYNSAQTQCDKIMDLLYALPLRDFESFDYKNRTIGYIFRLILKRKKRIPIKYLSYVMDMQQYMILYQRKTLYCVEKLLKNPERLLELKIRIQAIINSVRYSGHVQEGILPDYILYWNKEDKPVYKEAKRFLEGERSFLYRMFRMLYESKSEYPHQFNLFYAYLLLKEKLRGEMLQVNSREGLQNFISYQNRKNRFIHEKRLEDILVRMAVLDTLADKNIISMEIRISPQNSAVENVDYIRHLDQVINVECNEELESKYYYVLHFVKGEDKNPIDKFMCRHAVKRAEVKRKACALAEFREKYPLVAERVFGIDAASQEIGCRPEVFAQAFRFLKFHTAYNEGSYLPSLKATYHVGEDFLDILDGLRAIDESVLFCNLDCGDRLGHAMALGLNVHEWYRHKGYSLYLTKQDYLDNLAWLHGRMVHYGLKGFDDLKTYLEAEFEKFFKIVYIDQMDMDLIKDILDDIEKKQDNKEHRTPGISRNTYLNYDIRTYYNAWKLRGDNPECYKNGYFEDPIEYGNTYNGFSVNSRLADRLDVNSLRYIPEVAILYYTYHFNQNVKKEGNKRISLSVSSNWAAGVAAVQKELQKSIQRRGIAIETNPSSNVLIGTFHNYKDHPIKILYNNHLVSEPEKLAECPQISVSINTDDKEIFSTSLENEYALMACSLELAQGDDGVRLYNQAMIYEWLEEIRKMGNVQSFNKCVLAEGRFPG